MYTKNIRLCTDEPHHQALRLPHYDVRWGAKGPCRSLNCFVSQHDAVDDVDSQVGLVWLRMCRVNPAKYLYADPVGSSEIQCGGYRPNRTAMFEDVDSYVLLLCVSESVVVMLTAKPDRYV